MMDSKLKVLIIGAGVAGLALAQILRKHNINFEIFERDNGSRGQGWSIALDECLDQLQDLLPNDLESLYKASANQSIGKPDGFEFLDGQTHESLGVVGNVEKTHFGHNVSASRDVFRKILMKHLNIHFGKRLIRYEEERDGVTVFFGDGTTAKGDLLVGADGSNSSVRSQLLDGFKAVQSQYVVLHGNTSLQRAQYEPLIAAGNTGIITGQPGLKFTILLLELLENDKALFNWTCAFRSQNHAADHQWSEVADKESLFNRAMEIIDHLPKHIVAAVRNTTPSGVHMPPIKLRETLLPQQCLPRGRTTLVGDSAHSMVPFRGMGANTAILDVCDLARGIIWGIQSGAELDWVLTVYEKKMVPRGRTKVLESRATGDSDDAIEVSGGRLQREKLLEKLEGVDLSK